MVDVSPIFFMLLVWLSGVSCSTGTYLPVSCYDHLEAAKHKNRNISDGVYNISYNGSPLSVYCDMTQDGGGWILMVGTNTGLNWNTGNIYSRNTANPGLDIDYSILSIADAMKDKILLPSFEYRIEVSARSRWGGIWRAPVTYSVASEDETQTNIEEIAKFDSYIYHDGLSVGFRVPWVFSSHAYSLLTTCPRQTTPWWGTLIIHNSGIPNNNWGLNAIIEQGYRSGGNLHNVKPIYYWMRNFNMKIILESLSPINANSCKDQHFMIDDDNTTCVSRDTINCAGCVFTYKFNASVYCDTTHVMIYGQFIQGLTFLVYTTGDEEMENHICEELGTTNREKKRIFRCSDIQRGELNVAVLIGNYEQNFLLCEVHILNYIVT